MSKQSTKVSIKGADPHLAELLPNYELNNYETRDNSKGEGFLYIRMRKPKPAVKLAVA